MHPKQWLIIRPEGLYCKPGKFYIDPINSVESAIITHGHADHARPGHDKVLATPETIGIMKLRYGDFAGDNLQTLSYHQPLKINNVVVKFIPAGHILGSAQISLEYQNNRVIISGDYKRHRDPTCLPFVIEQCDVFITEATFGLPVFCHPPVENEINKLLVSLQTYPERCHLVGVYALGKCQRLIMQLREQGFNEIIYLHGALIKLTEFYQKQGFDFGKIANAMDLKPETSRGKIILCPPSALHDRWTRRFSEVLVANASGWMQIRARAKQMAVDLPLIISDHADWIELNDTIDEVSPNEVWVTHGREEALVYQSIQKGYLASALNLIGYDENEDE